MNLALHAKLNVSKQETGEITQNHDLDNACQGQSCLLLYKLPNLLLKLHFITLISEKLYNRSFLKQTIQLLKQSYLDRDFNNIYRSRSSTRYSLMQIIIDLTSHGKSDAVKQRGSGPCFAWKVISK